MCWRIELFRAIFSKLFRPFFLPKLCYEQGAPRCAGSLTIEKQLLAVSETGASRNLRGWDSSGIYRVSPLDLGMTRGDVPVHSLLANTKRPGHSAQAFFV